MSVQRDINKMINSVAGGVAAIKTGKELANKKKTQGENETLNANLETNIANRNINNVNNFLTKNKNVVSKNKLAKLKIRQELANQFRENMASLINSKVENRDMPMKEKLELQDRLYAIDDDTILSNVDNFKNLEIKDKLSKLKEIK